MSIPVVWPQILIVTSTAFAGVLLLNYQRDYAEWLLPLIIVCLFSFLVAHCFLSVFEIVVDVLFLCFAIDTKYNDGTPGKEFFMDKALMVRLRPSRPKPPVLIIGWIRLGHTGSQPGQQTLFKIKHPVLFMSRSDGGRTVSALPFMYFLPLPVSWPLPSMVPPPRSLWRAAGGWSERWAVGGAG